MTYCIGLTGNIASGKTQVASLFMQKNIDVFSADAVARAITAPGTLALAHIREHFGDSVIFPNGQLNRQALRHHIFSHAHDKLWLEQLLHPLIRECLARDVHLSKTPYCMVEIPLLLDKNGYPYLNRVLLVMSEESIQIERVMQRDQCSKEHAQVILASQPSVTERLKHVDDVLHNDSGLDELSEQVDTLHQRYLAYSSQNIG